ncbi:hypothetical protein K470DRAFT_261496 [Piedraia hortae CBS 480.64]|uniref:Uncharacterized protein n=1 Tax=Piedraia hortae CBS 480.64 TaxID=1314780 RepID=A0A6A7CBT9_9PEZI|nr:hypothetical protein K470DRAFT_261496 [Piedraia hortae CBS 480.64]
MAPTNFYGNLCTSTITYDYLWRLTSIHEHLPCHPQEIHDDSHKKIYRDINAFIDEYIHGYWRTLTSTSHKPLRHLPSKLKGNACAHVKALEHFCTPTSIYNNFCIGTNSHITEYIDDDYNRDIHEDICEQIQAHIITYEHQWAPATIYEYIHLRHTDAHFTPLQTKISHQRLERHCNYQQHGSYEDNYGDILLKTLTKTLADKYRIVDTYEFTFQDIDEAICGLTEKPRRLMTRFTKTYIALQRHLQIIHNSSRKTITNNRHHHLQRH